MAGFGFVVLTLLLVLTHDMQASLDSTFFRTANLRFDMRQPGASEKTGDFVTVGHFKGTMRAGKTTKCNPMKCFPRAQFTYKGRGQNDIFLSKFNSSRVLQWVRVAGGTADDKAQAVTATLDGRIVVAGYFTGTNVVFGQDPWDTFVLSSRTVLERTLFVALYTPNGTVSMVAAVGSCGMDCDVQSISADETGLALTGRYRTRITFGLKEDCTPEGICIPVSHSYLNPYPESDKPVKKSTGSGNVFKDHCWVAKYDLQGRFRWRRSCAGPALQMCSLADTQTSLETCDSNWDGIYSEKCTVGARCLIGGVSNGGCGLYTPDYSLGTCSEEKDSLEIKMWREKAFRFWNTRPEDKSRHVGKEDQYDQYSRYRTPYFGNQQPPSFDHPYIRTTYGIVEPPLSTNKPS